MAEFENTFYLDVFEHNGNGDEAKHKIANLNHRVRGDITRVEYSTTIDSPVVEPENSFYLGVVEEAPPNCSNQKDITIERIFLITNLVVELPSAVFDQLSSVHKPQYALISMVMSLVVVLVCIIDLAYKGRKERVKWIFRRSRIPWFYSPNQDYKPLGTFADIVGLAFAIFQCVFATIAFAFLSHKASNPIKLSILPIIFAFALLCFRFPRNSRTRITLDDERHSHNPRQFSEMNYHLGLFLLHILDKNMLLSISELLVFKQFFWWVSILSPKAN